MLFLQSCTNSLKVVSGLCSERRATLSGVSTNVEEVTVMDITVEEVPVVKFEEKTVMDIKEDIPWDVTSPVVKAEHDQVSYLCVCPLLDTFYKYPVMPTIFCDLQHSLCQSVTLSGHIILLHCDKWKCLYFCWVV
jgi:hypothetical protein